MMASTQTNKHGRNTCIYFFRRVSKHEVHKIKKEIMTWTLRRHLGVLDFCDSAEKFKRRNSKSCPWRGHVWICHWVHHVREPPSRVPVSTARAHSFTDHIVAGPTPGHKGRMGFPCNCEKPSRMRPAPNQHAAQSQQGICLKCRPPSGKAAIQLYLWPLGGMRKISATSLFLETSRKQRKPPGREMCDITAPSVSLGRTRLYASGSARLAPRLFASYVAC